jgi:hypothetical protein
MASRLTRTVDVGLGVPPQRVSPFPAWGRVFVGGFCARDLPLPQSHAPATRIKPCVMARAKRAMPRRWRSSGAKKATPERIAQTRQKMVPDVQAGERAVDAFRDLGNQMQKVYADPKMTPDQKRARLNALTGKMLTEPAKVGLSPYTEPKHPYGLTHPKPRVPVRAVR